MVARRWLWCAHGSRTEIANRHIVGNVSFVSFVQCSVQGYGSWIEVAYGDILSKVSNPAACVRFVFRERMNRMGAIFRTPQSIVHVVIIGGDSCRRWGWRREIGWLRGVRLMNLRSGNLKQSRWPFPMEYPS